MNIFKTLFSRNAQGERFWSIELDKVNACYRIHHGWCDIERSNENTVATTGSVITTNWKYSTAKFVGKSNEISAQEQSELEVERLVIKKKKEEYFFYNERLTDTGLSHRVELMLADTYNPLTIKPTHEVFFQPKLDGVRCYVELQSLIARSRYHNRFPKIEVELNNIKKDKLVEFQNQQIILDGEIYCHGKEIGQIISQLRRGIVDCTYNVFDVIVLDNPMMLFSERIKLLSKIVRTIDSPFIKSVHTIVTSINSMENFYEQVSQAYDNYSDYEGLMIRLNAPYVHDRSKYLLKLKKMLDREFILVNFIEGEGQSAGLAASAIVKLIYTEEDKKMFPFLTSITIPPECGVNVTGDADLRRKYLLEENQLIGSKVTVRFQEYISSGMIRFGELISIRDYE